MHERVKYLILNYLKILRLYALSRTPRLLSPEQHVIISAYIKSLFNYCLLVWMFCNRGIMHKLNKIQELSLLTKLQGLFQDLLRSSGDISMHQRCINLLLTEACKFIHALSPETMNEVFSTTANIFKTRQFKCFQNSHTYLEQI